MTFFQSLPNSTCLICSWMTLSRDILQNHSFSISHIRQTKIFSTSSVNNPSTMTQNEFIMSPPIEELRLELELPITEKLLTEHLNLSTWAVRYFFPQGFIQTESESGQDGIVTADDEEFRTYSPDASWSVRCCER